MTFALWRFKESGATGVASAAGYAVMGAGV